MTGVPIDREAVPIPTTVSVQAQAFLARPPWGDGPEPPPHAVAMWTLRPVVETMLTQMVDAARRRYPVDVRELTVEGVRLIRVAPRHRADQRGGPVLINLHGGGFVLGSGSIIEAIPIAHLADVVVVSVDYRLAPEHPYPAAVDDVVAVYRRILSGHAPHEIAIYGASAGGFLTTQVLARLAQESLPMPACAGIFTAGGDFTSFGDSAQLFALSGLWGQLILPFDHSLSEIGAYLGGADPRDPAVSPIFGDLSTWPPTLLVTGTRDALLSATTSMHRALRRAGRDADLFVYEAMTHAHWYNVELPEAQEALDVMAGFFRKHLALR